MKRLLLLGVVVTFAVCVNAEAPPSLPFASMAWPASTTTHPTTGRASGTSQATFKAATCAQVQRRLGTPSHHARGWKAYNFRAKVPGDCEGGYDLLNWLFIKSLRGQVATIYAGQVSSC